MELSPLNAWQPIEQIPKDGSFFDVWNGSSRIVDAWWSEDHQAILSESLGYPAAIHHFTHFLRIPEAP